MNCDEVELELIGFQTGTLPPALRRAVEGHLQECPRCLRSHLALKRQTDGVEPTPPPSEASRERLRRTVAQSISRPGLPRPPRWERPLAFALAIAAVLVAIATTHGLYNRPTTPPRTALSVLRS